MGRLRYHCLSGLLLGLALAAKAEEATTATVRCDKKDDDKKEPKFSHFTEIFYTVLFIVLVWFSGGGRILRCKGPSGTGCCQFRCKGPSGTGGEVQAVGGPTGQTLGGPGAA